MVLRLIIAFIIGLGIGLAHAQAADSGSQAARAESRPESRLEKQLKQGLSQVFPGARIELVGSVRWTAGNAQPEAGAISNLSENGRGEATFTATGVDGISQGSISFAAWTPAWLATRRIMPGEKLTPDQFFRQEINLASGLAHEYRGVVYAASQEVAGLESRQTVLEGQFLLSTSVERIPDVRRGDIVRILMTAGGLQLTTQGVAEEPAYVDGKIRVMTNKTKHELVGMLRGGNIVEVNL